MTTPEAMRQRQLAIQKSQHRITVLTALYVVLVGLALIGAVVYFNHRTDANDMATRKCIAENTAKQSEVLRIRADLSAEETDINGEVANAVARWQQVTQRLFLVAGEKQDDPQAVAALYETTKRQWVRIDHRLDRIEQARADLAKERAKNPIPEFPAGTCE